MHGNNSARSERCAWRTEADGDEEEPGWSLRALWVMPNAPGPRAARSLGLTRGGGVTCKAVEQVNERDRAGAVSRPGRKVRPLTLLYFTLLGPSRAFSFGNEYSNVLTKSYIFSDLG